MSKRIALLAKRHSGKTSLAKFLIERGFQRVGFADEVKDIHVACHNLLRVRLGLPPTFSREQLEQEKELHRVDLQRVGNDHGRRYDNEAWIKLLRKKLPGLAGDLVIDDLRYSNEASMLRDEGFLIVKIVRDERERTQSIRDSLFFQRAKDLGLLPDDINHAVVIPNERQREIMAWVEEELEKTLNHASEMEVDLISADVMVANTGLDALAQAAEMIVAD